MSFSKTTKTALAFSIILALAGCGDSSSDSSSTSVRTTTNGDNNNGNTDQSEKNDQNNGNIGNGGDAQPPAQVTRRPTIQMSGAVVDGYIRGATVCLDLNLNGRCDDWEPYTTTDEEGRYTLKLDPENNPDHLDFIEHDHIKKAPLLVQGGFDTDFDTDEGEGQKFLSTLSSPTPTDFANYLSPVTLNEGDAVPEINLGDDNNNITAVTSILNRVLERELRNVDPLDRARVEDLVREQLGIPEETSLTADPVALLDEPEGKADFLATNVSINRAIETLVSTAGAADEVEWREVSANVFRALVIAIQEVVAETSEVTAAGSVVAADDEAPASARLLERAAKSPNARRLLAGLAEDEDVEDEDKDPRLIRAANTARIASTTARQTDTIYRESQGDTREERLQAAARTSTNVVRMVEAAVRDANLGDEGLDEATTSRVIESAQAAAEASTENDLLIRYLRLRLIKDRAVDFTTGDGHTEDSMLVKALRALAGENSANEFDDILSLRAIYPYLNKGLNSLTNEQQILLEALFANIENTLRQDVENFLVRLGYQVPDNINLENLQVTDNGSITLPTYLTIDSVIQLDGFPEDLAASIRRVQNAVSLLRKYNIRLSQGDLFKLRGLELFYHGDWDNNASDINRLQTLRDEESVPASIRTAIAKILQNFAVVDALTEEGIVISPGERDSILSGNFGEVTEITFVNLDAGGSLHTVLPSSVQRKIQRTSRALALLEKLHILEDLSDEDIKALRGDTGITSFANPEFTVQQLYLLYLSDEVAKVYLSALQDLKELNEDKIQSLEDYGFVISELPQNERDGLIWRPRDSEDLSDYPTLFGWIQARDVIDAQLSAEGLTPTNAESIVINQQISTSGGLSEGQDLLSWLKEADNGELSRLTEPSEFIKTEITAAAANELLNEVLWKAEHVNDLAGPAVDIVARSYLLEFAPSKPELRHPDHESLTLFHDVIIYDVDDRIAQLCINPDATISWEEIKNRSNQYTLSASNCFIRDEDWDGHYHGEPDVYWVDGTFNITVNPGSDYTLDLTISTPQIIRIGEKAIQIPDGQWSHQDEIDRIYIENMLLRASFDEVFSFSQHVELLELPFSDTQFIRITDYHLGFVEDKHHEYALFHFNYHQRFGLDEIAVRIESLDTGILDNEYNLVEVDYPGIYAGRVLAIGAEGTSLQFDADGSGSAYAQWMINGEIVCSNTLAREWHGGRVISADICGDPPSLIDDGNHGGDGDYGYNPDYPYYDYSLTALAASDAGSIAQYLRRDSSLVIATRPLIDFVDQNFHWGVAIEDIFTENCSFVDTGSRFTFENCTLKTSGQTLHGAVDYTLENPGYDKYEFTFSTTDLGPLNIDNGQFLFYSPSFQYEFSYDGSTDRYHRDYYADRFELNTGGEVWRYWHYRSGGFINHGESPSESFDSERVHFSYDAVQLPNGLTLGAHRNRTSSSSFGVTSSGLRAHGANNTSLEIRYEYEEELATAQFWAEDNEYLEFTFDTADFSGDYTVLSQKVWDGRHENSIYWTEFDINNDPEIKAAIRLGMVADPVGESLEPLLQAVTRLTYYFAFDDKPASDSPSQFCTSGSVTETIENNPSRATWADYLLRLSFQECTFADQDGGYDRHIDGDVEVFVDFADWQTHYDLIRMHISTYTSNNDNDLVHIGVNIDEVGNSEFKDVRVRWLVREAGFIEAESFDARPLKQGDNYEAVYALRYDSWNSIYINTGDSIKKFNRLQWEGRYFTFEVDPDNEILDVRYDYELDFEDSSRNISFSAGYSTLDNDLNWNRLFQHMRARAEGERFLTQGSFRVSGGNRTSLVVHLDNYDSSSETQQAVFEFRDSSNNYFDGEMTHIKGSEISLDGFHFRP